MLKAINKGETGRGGKKKYDQIFIVKNITVDDVQKTGKKQVRMDVSSSENGEKAIAEIQAGNDISFDQGVLIETEQR